MKGFFKALICLAASVAALTVTAAGLEFLLPPVVALAAFMAAEWGVLYLLPALFAVLIGCCVPGIGYDSGRLAFELTPAVLCGAAAFGLYALTFAIFLRRKVKHRWAVLVLTAILCIGMYLRLTLGSMLEGKAPSAGVVSYLYSVEEMLPAALGSAYDKTLGDAMSAFIGVIPDILLMICLVAAEAAALATVLLARVWYRVFKKTPAPMARFADWRLPSSILLGTGLMIGVCVLAFILKLDAAPALGWTVSAALISLYSVQGMAYLMFVFEHSKAPAYIRAIAWVGAFMLLPYSSLFLTFMGFMEQVSKKRRVIAEYEKQMTAERARRSKADEYEKYGYVRTQKPPAKKETAVPAQESSAEEKRDNENEI